MTRQVFVGEMNEERDARGAESREIGRSMAVGNSGVIAEIDHGLEVQVCLGILIELLYNAVSIANGVFKVCYIVLYSTFAPYGTVCRIAVEEMINGDVKGKKKAKVGNKRRLGL